MYAVRSRFINVGIIIWMNPRCLATYIIYIQLTIISFDHLIGNFAAMNILFW